MNIEINNLNVRDAINLIESISLSFSDGMGKKYSFNRGIIRYYYYNIHLRKSDGQRFRQYEVNGNTEYLIPSMPYDLLESKVLKIESIHIGLSQNLITKNICLLIE